MYYTIYILNNLSKHCIINLRIAPTKPPTRKIEQPPDNFVKKTPHR